MARQKPLPGVDPKRKAIPVLEEATEIYAKSVGRLVTARTKCGEAKAALLQHMRDQGLSNYEDDDGKTYSIVPGKEKISISDKEAYPDADEEDVDGAAAN